MTTPPGSDYEWDVFISHASEDKAEAARPLARALMGRGVRVWYDETELVLGDNLRERIEYGLSRSRFGVVILSPSFFVKDWPKTELDGLLQFERDGRAVILPVWHNVAYEDVRRFSPILATKVASKIKNGVDKVVQDILRALGLIDPSEYATSILGDLREDLNRVSYSTVLEPNFRQDDPGLRLVLGAADYFKGGSYGIGTPGGIGIVALRDVVGTNIEVKFSFEIADHGGDESHWLGILLRASNPFLGGGFLVYFRSNGSVELQLPSLKVMSGLDQLSSIVERRVGRVRIQAHGSALRVEDLETGTTLALWEEDEIREHGPMVVVHAFGVAARIRGLQIGRETVEAT